MKRSKNKQIIENFIRKFDLQKAIGKDLVEYVELHSFERDEDIYTIDEKPDYLYFLVSGKVKISMLLKNGSRMLMRFSIPFSMLGDLELLNDYTVKTSVSAVCKSDCFSQSRNTAFGKIKIQHPGK
ncbi:MAG: cyclic nucleotide-binding domain-containing protein [Kosmotoga sp.]|nr:MAG: cyclic nucleotide-binding domain-containing protein [Kosmotoga sp.]